MPDSIKEKISSLFLGIFLIILVFIQCLLFLLIKGKIEDKRFEIFEKNNLSSVLQNEYVIKKPENTVSSSYLRSLQGKPIGVLSCEKIGLNVALAYSNGQQLCDKEDTAIVMPISTGFPALGSTGYALIGDHNFQNFNALQNIQEGDLLYIDADYGQFVYEVENIQIGEASESGTTFCTEDGTPIKTYCNAAEGKGIVLYTCYPFEDALDLSQRLLVTCRQIDGTNIDFAEEWSVINNLVKGVIQP